jgi:mersacidin/lichenicidin family type 2 lantibiotic
MQLATLQKGDFQMNIDKIIRAWEDPEYRKSLSEEERAKLPENPVGRFELTEDELKHIWAGAQNTKHHPGPGEGQTKNH